jgi:hypothetical protein
MGRAEPDVLFPPPPEVIKRVCERLPWLRCRQYDDFYAEPPLNPKDELNESELHLYDEMVSRNGVSSRYRLTEALVGSGKISFARHTAQFAYSPFLRQLDRGIFAFRGWPLDAHALACAQSEVGGEAERDRKAASPDRENVLVQHE